MSAIREDIIGLPVLLLWPEFVGLVYSTLVCYMCLLVQHTGPPATFFFSSSRVQQLILETTAILGRLITSALMPLELYSPVPYEYTNHLDAIHDTAQGTTDANGAISQN